MGVLARGLFVFAAIVLLLSLAAGVSIAGSESSVPGVDEIQRENRGAIAFATIAFGLVSAGVLSGLAGIMRLLLAQQLNRD
ncbi:hypothetical protein BH10ACT11_BH10ACT11_08030 [soil metagenome]